MENKKIEGKDLGNVAGGAYVEMNYCTPDNTEIPKNQGTLFVNDSELEMLKEAHLLNEDGHIDEENLDLAGFLTWFQPIENKGKNKIIIDIENNKN